MSKYVVMSFLKREKENVFSEIRECLPALAVPVYAAVQTSFVYRRLSPPASDKLRTFRCLL